MNIDTGKAALVFGGSRGIGAAIVERLVREGYAVAFTYISSDAAAYGNRAKSHCTRRSGESDQG